MKNNVKLLLFFASLTILFSLYGCSKNIKVSKYFETNYTKVIALASRNKSADIYNITNGKLDKLGNIPNLSDIVYDANNTIHIYLLNLPGGENLQHNNIKIEDDSAAYGSGMNNILLNFMQTKFQFQISKINVYFYFY